MRRRPGARSPSRRKRDMKLRIGLVGGGYWVGSVMVRDVVDRMVLDFMLLRLVSMTLYIQIHHTDGLCGFVAVSERSD